MILLDTTADTAIDTTTTTTTTTTSIIDTTTTLSSVQVTAWEKKCTESVADLEHIYEMKLAQESLYLDKMRQAYDEYVAHSKLDLGEVHENAGRFIGFEIMRL